MTSRLLLASVAGAGAGLVLALGGRVIMGFFSDASAVVDSGEVLLWYLLPYLVLLAGVVGPGGVFMGGSRTRSLFWVTVLGACVQLPFAYALSSVPALDVHGVWLSMIIGTAAQYVMTVLLFRRLVASAGPARESKHSRDRDQYRRRREDDQCDPCPAVAHRPEDEPHDASPGGSEAVGHT
ncbi:hypothetical protein ABZ723_32215 [Streptomyces sp. NPDC006700]|uniref:hypothetical protein n=2 Tax=unclassified Streptomyces TaxID=2593676 RepID=UPI0033E45861